MARAITRWQEATTVAVGGSAMTLALVSAAFAPWWYTFPISMLLLGTGYSLCHSTLQTRASEALPSMRGTAIAVFAFSFFMGNGLGALVIGAVLPAAGYATTFASTGAGLGLFTLTAVRYTRPLVPSTQPSARLSLPPAR